MTAPGKDARRVSLLQAPQPGDQGELYTLQELQVYETQGQIFRGISPMALQSLG